MKYFGDWIVSGYSKEDYKKLNNAGFSSLVSALLCSRGVSDPAAAKELLRDDIGLFNDPFLMADMVKGITRIKKAIEDKERIAVYGDYDVDGITAACLITDYLRKKGLFCMAYIPERLTEGYGISEEALKSIRENGVSLIITVDCGITALPQIETARELGMDVIITDHHECPAALPDAVAVINPRRKDCGYPFKGLAGVGVAFKLVCALEGADISKTVQLIEEYGDLVAIGTIADIMPVREENRAIIIHGIKVLGRSGRLGLRRLVEESCPPNRSISPNDISFTIIPKLNAAGRMGNVRLAYKLLMTQNEAEASKLVNELCKLNQERRLIENRIFDQAYEMVKAGGKVDGPIVLASEQWHHGVSGIVAARLSDCFGVPAIIICIEGQEGRGSCRSYGFFNIFEALEHSKEYLTSYGGHAFAAGLTINKDSIDAFRESFCDYFLKNEGKSRKPDLLIDFEVEDLNMLSQKEVEAVSAMSPWGNGNPPPVLCISDVHIDSIIPIGYDKHLKLRISRDGHVLECVFFSVTADEFILKAGAIADFAFEPVINEFRGNRSVQLFLRDVRPSKRHIEMEKQICKSFFSGNGLTAREKHHILPKRTDFARVWRYISTCSVPLSGDVDDIVFRIAFDSRICNTGKTYVCLKVFDELDLLNLNENDGKINIVLADKSKKVDLNSSVFMSRLKG